MLVLRFTRDVGGSTDKATRRILGEVKCADMALKMQRGDRIMPKISSIALGRAMSGVIRPASSLSEAVRTWVSSLCLMLLWSSPKSSVKR